MKESQGIFPPNADSQLAKEALEAEQEAQQMMQSIFIRVQSLFAEARDLDLLLERSRAWLERQESEENEILHKELLRQKRDNRKAINRLLNMSVQLRNNGVMDVLNFKYLCRQAKEKGFLVESPEVFH